MNAAIDSLCGFVLANLPDSLRERKALLAAMYLILPRAHKLRAGVRALQMLLESHEKHQLSLALDFQKQINPEKEKSK